MRVSCRLWDVTMPASRRPPSGRRDVLTPIGSGCSPPMRYSSIVRQGVLSGIVVG